MAETDTLCVLATLGKNRAHWQPAVRTLFAHYTIPFHLFVALDEGTQEDVDWFRELGAVVDHSPGRRGLVGSYNTGFNYFRAQEYPYLHLLEDGLALDRGWDTALRKTLDAHPEFGWVACAQQENAKAKFTAYCSLLHRAAVEKVGGIDPRFSPCYFDDGDLFLRLEAAGYRPHGIPWKVSHPVSRTGRDWDDTQDALLLVEKRILFQILHGKPDFAWDEVSVHGGCEACT